MRLKSEIWVKAYCRTCASQGAPAMVVRHGDDDAGAIFIKVARLDGTAALYGPAPAGLEPDSGDRSWVPHVDSPRTSDGDVEAYLARQIEYDPDIWIVEVEDREGRSFLGDWLARVSKN